MESGAVSENLLPNALIIGAEKAGTSSLFYYLSQHPQIVGSYFKETYLLSQHDRPADSWAAQANRERCLRGLADYSRMFAAQAEAPIRLEACPAYLYDYEHVIASLKRVLGNDVHKVRIVVLLRDPVKRIGSSYRMKQRNGTENLTLEAALDAQVVAKRRQANWHFSFDYVGVSTYAPALRAYQEVFDSVEVFPYDLLTADAGEICNQLCERWGLVPWRFNTSTKFNVSGRPKSRVHGLLARLLYQPNMLKKWVKAVVPAAGFRKRLKAALGTQLLEPVDDTSRDAHVELPASVVQVLRDDLDELRERIEFDCSAWAHSLDEAQS